MRSLIRLRGGLPTEHRVTAWKYLLKLPCNAAGFAQQVAQGPHSAAMTSLATRYPVRDRKLFRKTAIVFSALAHWSPILAEVEFVPGWVFPFVVVFSQVRDRFVCVYYLQDYRLRRLSSRVWCVLFHERTAADRVSLYLRLVRSAEERLVPWYGCRQTRYVLKTCPYSTALPIICQPPVSADRSHVFSGTVHLLTSILVSYNTRTVPVPVKGTRVPVPQVSIQQCLQHYARYISNINVSFDSKPR